MKISRSNRKRFSQLLSTAVDVADDEVTLNTTLEELSLTDLEQLKAYLSGSMSTNLIHILKFIIIYSFFGSSLVYLVYIYQANTMIIAFTIGILLGILLEGLLIILKVPFLSHSILTYRRRRYDRIVQLIEVILKKKYLKELKSAIIDF
ncbi:hypothetical protein HCB37_00570 [Listeria booriae]|uniref:hypothetical protein n=1 Tax=Listeria booriae TaxID=1552123 RepID=UPI0016270187|nr:hypothetical protein [Listeria booriae]MBC2262996.1 hypothetical protein [Listeria booriae]